MSPTVSHLALLAAMPSAATASVAPADAVAIGTDAVPTQTSAAAAQAIVAPPYPAPAKTTTAQLGAPASMPHAPAGAGSIGGALFALALVIGLILALAWLARRMPGFGGGARANPALRVVGSLPLGPRERVVVVAVGQTQLLLGVGAGGTRTLHALEAPLPEPSAAAKGTPAFAQLLAQHFGKKA